MRSSVRKNVAIFVSIIYTTTQVALGSVAESNIWAERRGKMQHGDQKDPVQLAALPSNFNPASSQILPQLPSISPALSSFPKWSQSQRKNSVHVPKNFQDVIDALSLTNGSVQDLYDAGNQSTPIVLIQDVHLNAEAQSNIASILQELIDQKQVGIVGVEGAFNALPLAPFREFPDKEIARTVASSLMEHNMLAAPSYVGITSPTEPPLFLGVDDPQHYASNVNAYLESQKIKSQAVESLKKMKAELADSKNKTFSKDLRTFDDLRSAYHQTQINLGVYVKKLSVYDVEKSWMVEQFLAAYEMESHLDFSKIENDRRTIIERLTKTLNPKEVSELVSESIAYKTGRLGFGAYYQGLKDLCARKGISLRQAPAFDNYVRYVLLSDGIKAEELFKGIDQMEQQILAQLATTPDQKQLVLVSERVSLVDKLLEFSLTPNEWKKFESMDHGPSSIDQNLSPFKRFYQEADARSHSITKKLLGSPVAGARVLVAGGFHTPQIAQLLKDQKLSYVIVSPKITKIEDSSGTSYLSVFSREKTLVGQTF